MVLPESSSSGRKVSRLSDVKQIGVQRKTGVQLGGVQQKKIPNRGDEEEAFSSDSDDTVSMKLSTESCTDDETRELRTFMSESNSIKKTIEYIATTTDRLEQMYVEKGTSVSKTKSERQVSRNITALSSEIEDMVRIAIGRLKHLKEEVTQFELKSPGDAGVRIRKNNISTLTKKLETALEQYRDLQTKEIAAMKKTTVIDTQSLSATGAASGAVSGAVSGAASGAVSGTDSGAGVGPPASKQNLQQKLQQRQTVKSSGYIASADVAAAAMTDMQERQEAVLEIEGSLRELGELFVDMAVLVEQQGEELDQIEEQVNSTRAYVERGVTDLKKANRLAQSSRKKACCIVIIALLVLFAVVGVSIGVVMWLKKA